MRRPVCAVVGALTVLSCLSGSVAVAKGPTYEEALKPLTSVSKRSSYVFASTPDGLFRAPLSTKRWERLETPPDLPPNGTFAQQPGGSRKVLYVATRTWPDHRPRGEFRDGLYLSHNDGAAWELVCERGDFGSTVLLPNGVLYAVTGNDGINFGDQLLRSDDLGKSWRDITNNAGGQFEWLEPDPGHPGLVRIHAWSIQSYIYAADDEDYRWRLIHAGPGRTDDVFFSRDSFSTTSYCPYDATLSNYFQYDFGNRTSVDSLEVVPLKSRFEFRPGERVVVPLRVVFHYDPEEVRARWREARAEGHPYPKPEEPSIRFAVQPDGFDFWGIRVETSEEQIEKYPPPSGRDTITGDPATTKDVKTAPKTVTEPERRPAVDYQVFDLSPSSPHERDLDLGHFCDFSRPGEYRVQVLYQTGGHPDRKKGEWDGGFTSPVFKVVIRE